MKNKCLIDLAHDADKQTLKRVYKMYKILVSAGITFHEASYELHKVEEALKYTEIKSPSNKPGNKL